MNNVYFKRIDDFSDKDNVNNIVYEMMKEIIEKEEVNFDDFVPLKVHFGERGNDTFVVPDYFDGVRKYLKENNKKSCYIDTNVLYKGSRTYTKDHIATALEHGFNDLDIVIADSDDDNPYMEIEINQKHFSKCKIGTKYADYNNFIVLAHFKGHGQAGMGASLKQLAMGFASRGGKLHQHSDSIPVINPDICVSCGRCVEKCPVDAISLSSCAKIDPNTCIGCASCSTICPVNAISNTWKSSNFHEKLTEYAYAAQLNKKNLYITYAFNITKECDCYGAHQETIAPDIGVFISTDPVANDAAVLSMYEKISGKDNFKTAWLSIQYADKIGFGKKDYNLIEF